MINHEYLETFQKLSPRAIKNYFLHILCLCVSQICHQLIIYYQLPSKLSHFGQFKRQNSPLS